MNARRFASWLMALVILALGVAWFFQHRSKLLLEAEVEALRAKAVSAEAPAVAESRPPTASGNEYLELMRLRGEVGALRKQLGEPAKTPKKVRQAEVPPPVDEGTVLHPPVPLQNVQFVGYGTPEDALQSLVFAFKSGDTNLLLNSATPEAAPSILKEWVGKSDAEIVEMMKMALGEMETLDFSKRTTSEDGVVHFTITTKDQTEGDKRFKDESLINLTNVNGVWKLSEQ